MPIHPPPRPAFRDPNAAISGGYVLSLAGVLVAAGLVFHPLPVGGLAESASVLSHTPWWDVIHMMIAAGFVLCILGGLLLLVAGSIQTGHWVQVLSWVAISVGMIFS